MSRGQDQMRDLSEVGLDSQCLSYLIDALEGVAAPTDGLAEQKVALVRLYLYTPGTLWVTPTVEREFLRIRNEARRASHVSWTSVLFGVRPPTDAVRAERRAADLAPPHADVDDRMVLAEAEDIGFTTLLSFDCDFVKRLGPHAGLLLTRPAVYWDSLSVPRGTTPAKVPAHRLASQPSLSRLTRALAGAENREVLREAILEVAARRIKAGRGGHRMRYATIDVDGLPVEVHGDQPGSEYNGHYHARIYHPIIASLAETGDLLDIRLRPGNVHGAEGALEFVTSLVDRVEARLCQVASVRMDAGFPEEKLLAALEKRTTPYVARVRNNSVLDAMAEPLLRRPPGRPPNEPRTWTYERSYQAGSWSRPRRVVLVVMERPGELFLHHFWLITSWSREQMHAEDLLELYRERGAAEGHFGELMSVIAPALSSSPRQKSHYRGAVPSARTPPGDGFAQNEAILLLNALAYNLAHAARVLMERATGEGWSLRRLRERVLRVAARVLLHGRRAVLVIGKEPASLWRALWSRLATWRYADA